MKTSRHAFEMDVRSYELDSYRHVNNAAYINWLEEARERFLREQGRDYHSYPNEHQAWFVVVRIEIDYRQSALAQERLRIETRLARLGRTSVTFRHCIRRAQDGTLLCRARVVMAFAGPDDRSCPIPADFLERYEASEEGDLWTEGEGGERS